MKLSELLKTKDQWCQHKLAVNDLGNEVDSLDTDAVKWCLMGAIEKCFSERKKVYKTIVSLIKPFTCVSDFNDESTFKDVKKVIKEFEQKEN